MGRIMETMDKKASIETRRECILKALIVMAMVQPSTQRNQHDKGKPANLVKKYLDIDLGAKKKTEDTVIGIYTSSKRKKQRLWIPQRTLRS
ncbi:hypothetical protein J4Q44_G00223390 [Coregonus suidteri]|uniref:Uncharacterized protein n=1 Tax=Coregonus suidteri TaxID=861788 RepID=A0AAN8QPD8_9TELE